MLASGSGGPVPLGNFAFGRGPVLGMAVPSAVLRTDQQTMPNLLANMGYLCTPPVLRVDLCPGGMGPGFVGPPFTWRLWVYGDLH